jgi:AraC-like DNA-binding protein
MADGLVLTRRESERGVHETAQRAGAGRSEAVVHRYVGYEEWPESGFYRREVARHGVALILGFGDPLDIYDESDTPGPERRTLGAFVVGNQLASSLTGVRGHQHGVQVELTPAGALALLGDVEQYNDAVVPLDQALGENGVRMMERLAETPSWAERLHLLDAAFATEADDVAPLSPEVDWLHHEIDLSGGQARVETLMDETGWSRRHVTERFRRQLGVSPKSYARLVRFERASWLLAENSRRRTVADVAMEAGYYDQSHLTRDFVALAGVTPGAFLANAELDPEVRFVQDDGPVRGAQ